MTRHGRRGPSSENDQQNTYYLNSPWLPSTFPPTDQSQQNMPIPTQQQATIITTTTTSAAGRAWRMINPASHFSGLLSAGSFKKYVGGSLWNMFFANKHKRSVPKSRVDRLNFHSVPIGLMAIATLITGDIFNLLPGGSEPMKCLHTPAENLKEEELEMAMEYCQSANTYWAHPRDGIPGTEKAREQQEIGYYHWMPLVLLLQALLFYLPNWVWMLSDGGQEFGLVVDISRGIDAGRLASNEADDETELMMEGAGTAKKGKFMAIVEGLTVREGGHRVTDFYMWVKLLSWLNVILQFWVTDLFLGHEYRYWGIRVLIALINGNKWTDSPIFPRFTFCDVPMFRFGNNKHVHTFRCFLRINVYIEKLYLVIWWALLVLALLTTFDFLSHTFARFCGASVTRHHAVRRLLTRHPADPPLLAGTRPSTLRHFADRTIREDGVLLLRFVEQYAGVDVAAALCGELYKRFDKRTSPCAVRVEGSVESNNSISSGSTSSSGSGSAGCGENEKKKKKTKLAELFHTKIGKLLHLSSSPGQPKHELLEEKA